MPISDKEKHMNLNYTNLPAWIEQITFFRKLFLLRKLYLTRTRFTHYSTFAEDVSIGRFFPKDIQGFFVDVGCFHPKKYNNTWQLYKNGWRGINIDLDSIKIEGFNIVRPMDTNICCAVSNAEGEVTYYSNGFYSSTISLDSNFVEGKKGYIRKKTRCKRLTDIIEESKYKDRKIDFLSVDAEGYDFEVLQSLDFERYVPKLIAVETHKVLFTEVTETPLYKFLFSHDYCMVGWCGLTLLMANNALQRTLTSMRFSSGEFNVRF